MTSHSSLEPRHMPQQMRGRQRMAALLDAAASVIADVGYEAATMCAIAERADSCIGSLYQFFPNKPAITQALRSRYSRQFQTLWASLEAEAGDLDLSALASRLIDSTTNFAEGHPAFLALLDAPVSTRSPAAIRRLVRERVARVFRAKKPHLSKPRALQLAAVTLQILKALSQLYAEARPGERQVFVREFKMVLFCYLSAQLKAGCSRTRRPL